MPFIHWYPGHIAKAERKLKEQTSLVDVVLEIIDARIPLSSLYVEINKLIGDKPRLLILNKADLSDPEDNQKWQDYLKKYTGVPVLLNNSASARDISSIIKSAVDLGTPQIEKLMAKGLLPRPIRAMVVGMPNVGKSSIINKLIKTTKAKVGAKAGVTRSSQWVRVNPKLVLLDTPGIIPMRLEDQERAVKLAFVNSISENAYDLIEIAGELLKFLYERHPAALVNYYKLDSMEGFPTLEQVASARSWLLSGGRLDLQKCASMVLTDFRNGKMGRCTLESVPES